MYVPVRDRISINMVRIHNGTQVPRQVLDFAPLGTYRYVSVTDSYLKRLMDSKDNITEEEAAEEQAYEVVTQKVDVGGI